MGMRSVETCVGVGSSGVEVRLRIDLHGVATFGPGDDHRAIRWEWIDDLVPGEDELVVRSAQASITIPAGAFGLAPAVLAEHLRRATSIVERTDVIAELSGTG